MTTFLLTLRREVLAPILSVYFGFALEQRIFPNIFKTVKVIPLFKSGSKENVNNYRPISLLPSLSKVLEKLIKFRFVKFFDRHNCITYFMLIRMALEKSTVSFMPY